MRPPIRSVVLLLACAAVAAAKCPEPDPGLPPDPQAKVFFERVDPSRYPEVDVYFRLIDTNPKTGYHEPQPAEVKVQDGPFGGAVADMTFQSNNFANPLLRPLAMALCLDRSKSVDPVLPEINAAIRSYLGLMKPASANTPQKDDETYLMALCGGANMAGSKDTVGFLKPDPPSGPQPLMGFVNTEFATTCGGSPIYKAWETTIDYAQAHPFEEPFEARAVVTISDGKNNREPKTRTALTQQSKSAGINMFSIGPVLINGGKTVAKSVCRGAFVAIAQETDAAYFEARPPGVTVLPEPPAPEDDTVNAGDPATLPDDQAITYLQEALLTVKNMAAAAPADKLDRTETVSPKLEEMVTNFTTLNVTPTTWENYIAAVTGPPEIKNANLLTYDLLEQVDAGLALFANKVKTPIDPEVIKNTYNLQVAAMFQKIQASLKRVYKVTYTVPDGPFDGKDRTININTDYFTDVDGTARRITGGTSSVYRAPAIIPENQQVQFTQALGASERQAAVISGASSPRGGAWASDIQIATTVTLLGMAGNPAKPVKLAEKPAGGAVRFLTAAEGGPDVPLTAEEQTELAPYLSAISVGVDLTPGQVNYTIVAGMPTSIPDPAAEFGRPVANDSNPDKPRLVWYSLVNNLSRTYSYQVTRAGGAKVNATATARAVMNPLVIYVKDVTPPSLAVFLTPESRGTSRLEAREAPPEAAVPAQKFYLSGSSFGTAGELDQKSLARDKVEEPLDLEGGGSSLGFVVAQGVSVRLQLLARDNFDRNVVPEWPVPAPPAVAQVNKFDSEALSSEAARDGKPPYLARLNPDQVGQVKPTGKTRFSGISWSFTEGGSDTDAGVETRSFRAANVNVDGDTITPVSGQEIFLNVVASDATGNTTRIKLPVRVTPVGIEIDKLFQERERK